MASGGSYILMLSHREVSLFRIRRCDLVGVDVAFLEKVYDLSGL